MHPSISVVIVTWKVRDFLKNCINSIKRSDYDGNVEIIVIDNNSEDGTKEMLLELFPEIVFIENKINVGFARANNQGFMIANGEYIYILNPDTLISVDNLKILSSYLEKDQHIGMVCPKVVFGDGNIQKTCARRYPNLFKAFLLDTLNLHKIPFIGEKLEISIKFPYDYEQEQYIEAGVGAAMLIRKELLHNLGFFEEKFLHGGEDNYLCYKCNKFGYKIKYTPNTKVIHFTAESVKQANVRTSVNSVISNGYFFRLKSGLFHQITYKIIIMFFFVPIRFFTNTLYLISGRMKGENYLSQIKILYHLFLWKSIKS